MLQVLCSPVFNPHGPLSWEAGDATAQAGEVRDTSKMTKGTEQAGHKIRQLSPGTPNTRTHHRYTLVL